MRLKITKSSLVEMVDLIVLKVGPDYVSPIPPLPHSVIFFIRGSDSLYFIKRDYEHTNDSMNAAIMFYRIKN